VLHGICNAQLQRYVSGCSWSLSVCAARGRAYAPIAPSYAYEADFLETLRGIRRLKSYSTS